MKALKSLLAPKPMSTPSPPPAPKPVVVDVRQTAQRIMIEYILNMAVTCLAHGDVEPLYDQYLEDPRLSEEDREELARAYLLLQMAPVRPGEEADLPPSPGPS